MNEKILYIGLNGLAGSGKDTVAKMIKTILNFNWPSLEACKEYYKSVYTSPTISATHNISSEDKQRPVMCIAFADQLKKICSTIFGIPVQRFYENKSTAWVCINKDFQYTEIKPDENHIVTAEEYYLNLIEYINDDEKYFMSLREILVYVGTYVLQQDINKRTFVNIVRNTIKECSFRNRNIKYVIVTDIRFQHEIDYVRENNGVTITITRDGVQQLDNIAEHELDTAEEWDFHIENDGTYDELFEKVWNIIHTNVEFQNTIVDLETRDYIDNYLRLVDCSGERNVYQLCSPYEIGRISKEEGKIVMIDPVGGPMLCVNSFIEHTDLFITNIEFAERISKFLITLEHRPQQDNVYF